MKGYRQMEKIWKNFESLDGYVYVSDMNTYELVYLNKAARKRFLNNESADYVGKKCYELLHCNQYPCTKCNHEKLKIEEFEQYETFDPVVNENLMIINHKMLCNGRNLRLEIAFVITTAKENAMLAEYYYGVEKSIHNILKMANMQKSAEEAIEMIIAYIGKNICADRCYIFEEAGGYLKNTYEWCATGIVPQIDNLQHIPMDVASVWYDYFAKNQNVVIENIETIKESDPSIYNVLKPQDISSIIVGPLKDSDKIIGFYGVDNPPVEHLDYLSNMIEILSFFVMNSIKSKKFEILSMHDQMTGFLNRHALYEYQKTYVGHDSIGLVYFDVTGLKKVNDEHGHDEGDRLLIRVSHCINKVFPECSKFRVGGDEFIVICESISEMILRNRVEEVQNIFKEENLIVAGGITWKKKCTSLSILDELISEAEKDMYISKKLFYKNSGMERRVQKKEMQSAEEHIGYFTEKIYYASQEHPIFEEQEDTIIRLLCNNGGVGIIAGMFDEEYTIDFVSELILGIFGYDSFEDFYSTYQRSLLKMLGSKQEQLRLIDNISSQSEKFWYTELIGKNDQCIEVLLQSTVTKDHTGKAIWMLSVRKIK